MAKVSHDQGSRPTSGDLQALDSVTMQEKPIGPQDHCSALSSPSRELQAAIGDQHLAPDQRPYHTVPSSIKLYRCLEGKEGRRQVFLLLILLLTVQKICWVTEYQSRENNAETAILISFTPVSFLTARRLTGNIFDAETQGHRKFTYSFIHKEELSESNFVKVLKTKLFYDNNSCP